MHLTIQCSGRCTRCRFVCMLASSHFRTQTAIAYNAADWGVMRYKEKTLLMSNKNQSFIDRIISVLVSLIFSVPTAMLAWFGINKNIAFYGDGGILGVNVLWALIVASAVFAFVFPSVFPSILGAAWNGILRVQKWWGW